MYFYMKMYFLYIKEKIEILSNTNSYRNYQQSFILKKNVAMYCQNE